jgi:hypothetical protein
MHHFRGSGVLVCDAGGDVVCDVGTLWVVSSMLMIVTV